MRNNTERNKVKYITYRNRLKSLNKAEQDYYRQQFEHLKSNLKQTWQTIKFTLNKTNSSPLTGEFVIDSKTVIAHTLLILDPHLQITYPTPM